MMQKKQWLLLVNLAIAFLLINTSALSAAQKFQLNKNSTASQIKNITGMPDLVIKNAVWSSTPKAGDAVGASAILNITVWNRGSAPAGASKLKIDCKSLTSTNYPYPLAGMIAVQPLGAGQSMTYAWPSMSSEKWFSGTYRMTFTADFHFNSVKESNENNNTRNLTFTVLLKKDIRKNIKVEPTKKFRLIPDLELVSISMSPANPAAGENVEVTVAVKNTGKVKTPSVAAIMKLWDATPGADYRGDTFYKHLADVPSLIPGQTYYLRKDVRFTMFGDNAAVTVKIDRHNQFEEYNESNNEKTHSFSVKCKPDLAFEHHMQANPGGTMVVDAVAGQTCHIPVELYNNGWCQSKPGKIRVTGEEISPVLIDLPAISPCNVATGQMGYQVNLKWDTPGQKNCKIKIDSTNTNDESIEYNNELTVLVNVSAN